MSPATATACQLTTAERPVSQISIYKPENLGQIPSASLAAAITREASAQTYFTIRFLVDRPMEADAYRAYAYFRWVDDTLDRGQMTKGERLAFLHRQQAVVARCYRGEWPGDLRPEERMVADLIRGDRAVNSGLRIYIEEMMKVMVFDAERRDRLISRVELADYTRSLATAVTEALHYFIGHDDPSPQDSSRYVAVTGAHIVHMLRDAIEDATSGYYNLPRDVLEAHGISPTDVNHDAYRTWVRSRLQLARGCFTEGRAYLAQVRNPRCRLAGYAYIARFEVVLDAIEKEGYRLRTAYPERKNTKSRLKMVMAALTQTLFSSLPGRRASIPNPKPSTEVI